MDRRMKDALDRYITGNWGEDQLKNEDPIVETRDFGDCWLDFTRYTNKRTTIRLFSVEDDSSICVLTVNLPDEHLEPGEFFVEAQIWTLKEEE